MRQLTFLFLLILTASLCYAQAPVSKGGNVVATSQIRVSIPSYAVINLAENKSGSVNDDSSEITSTLRYNPDIQVVANDKWTVNIIRKNRNINPTENRKSTGTNTIPSYTVIYVTTRM